MEQKDPWDHLTPRELLCVLSPPPKADSTSLGHRIFSRRSGHLSQESAAHHRHSAHSHTGDGTGHGLFSSRKANTDSTACIATAQLSSTLTSKPCPNLTCERTLAGPGFSCQTVLTLSNMDDQLPVIRLTSQAYLVD